MTETVSGRPGTVLVVDDEPLVRTLFEVLLSRRGHTVVTAASVAEGRAASAQSAPDVAIIDMFMPDGNGVDLIRTLRRTCPRTRIIAITGGGTWEGFDVLTNAKDAGADITLRKPVPSEVIVEAVENLLA